MTHNQTRHQWHRKSLLFSLLILLVAIGCKKETKIIPPPPTSNELIGTSWIQQPLHEGMPMADKDIRIFTFYQNNGKDSLKVMTKDGKPYDNFWNGNNNEVYTNAFEYNDGKGKVFAKTGDLPFYNSFTINNNVLEIQSFGIGGYSPLLSDEKKAQAIQEIKDGLNNYPNTLVFQNGEIFTSFNNFDNTKPAIVTNGLNIVKYKKML